MSWTNALEGHPSRTTVEAGVDLERQVVGDGLLDAACHTPVAQAESLTLAQFLPTEVPQERTLGISVGALLPQQGRCVGVLCFDGDRERPVLCKQRRDRAAQAVDALDGYADLIVQRRRLDLAPAEAGPRQVGEEEVRAGGIGRARLEVIVDLHMVKVGDVAEQAQPLARPPQLPVAVWWLLASSVSTTDCCRLT